MEIKAKVHVDQLLSPAGHPVTVVRFEGDIAATSKDAVLGAYQRLPRESSKLILLDFSKVGYINSSGITLVIQLLREAYQSARKINAFGLSPHFTKVFTVAGIASYARLFHSEADALTAL
ncbi:MAG: STAS domain-containing protein [Terracidiphilus sp.]